MILYANGCRRKHLDFTESQPKADGLSLEQQTILRSAGAVRIKSRLRRMVCLGQLDCVVAAKAYTELIKVC
jgi:hypothetical protein